MSRSNSSETPVAGAAMAVAATDVLAASPIPSFRFRPMRLLRFGPPSNPLALKSPTVSSPACE
jgi:hypothetical protein